MTTTGLTFSHIGLYVEDLDKQTDFYTRVLGFFVTDHGEITSPSQGKIKLTFFSRDPEEHHQIVMLSGRDSAVDYDSVVNQLSFKVKCLDDLRAIHRNFLREGLTRFETVTHGNSISVYAHDPEGLRLEFYLHTPWYAHQPMLLPLDITESDEQVMAKVEAHARSLPGFKPREEWVRDMKKLMGVVD
ncbi:VOC family protein [Pseudomonas putida]|nr:VOC family protein [Pseudomonas putida]